MLEGIDVSKYQANIDWNKMTGISPKLSFALCRASCGDTVNNPAYALDEYFVRNWQGALDAQLVVGAYHYFCPRENPDHVASQAQTFLGQVKLAKRPTDAAYLPAIIDIEVAPGVAPGEVHVAQYLEGVRAWLTAVEANPIFAGMKSIIYTRADIWSALRNPTKTFAEHPIWLSEYCVKSPRIPLPWLAWNFWQYTDKGSRGDVYPIDCDLFNGDEAALRALTRAAN